MAKKKGRKQLTHGKVYIKSTFNNTIVTLTDPSGDVIAQGSTGKAGFDGTKQSTPYAASEAARVVADKLDELGTRSVEIYVKGVGPGRDSALRTIGHSDADVQSIKDETSLPHNGPRPRKPRRV